MLSRAAAALSETAPMARADVVRFAKDTHVSCHQIYAINLRRSGRSMRTACCSFVTARIFRIKHCHFAQPTSQEIARAGWASAATTSLTIRFCGTGSERLEITRKPSGVLLVVLRTQRKAFDGSRIQLPHHFTWCAHHEAAVGDDFVFSD
jgi:hypothetical protein